MTNITKHISIVFITLLAMAGFYAVNSYNYLLFHIFAELFSIIIAFGVFIIAWNARSFMTNHFTLFIGIAYFFVGLLDIMHLLTYQGMSVFSLQDANTATQFWIAARYLESTSLFIAPFMLLRRLNAYGTMALFSGICAAAILSILKWHIFPVCYLQDVGLTPFKKISEYIIVLILLAASGVLYRYRRLKDPMVFRWLLAAIGFSIAAEITFTEYVRVYDIFNIIGHYIEIISFFCIYKAVIEISLRRPYNTLFQDLKRSEEALKEAGVRLEATVRQRTADLQSTVHQLSEEVTRRIEAEKMLRRLSQKSIDALESDHMSVAREVHDSIGASLAAIKFMVEDTISKLDKSDGLLIEQLKKAVFYLGDTIQESRHISAKLRPLSLEELGLQPTIDVYVRKFEEIYTNIRVKTTFNAREEQVPENLKIVLYRVLQEGLKNVGRRSKATHVDILLNVDNGKLILEIKDNGKGFDAQIDQCGQIDGDVDSDLLNLCERTELLGGNFNLTSTPNLGTFIKIEFPINRMG